MQGKYRNPLVYAAAWANRRVLRARIRDLVGWGSEAQLAHGCSAIIGMCSAMPDVLIANLTSLKDHAWPELAEVIVVADTVREGVSPEIVREAAAALDPIPLRMAFYSDHQAAVTQKLRISYVYSWLSWCIGLSLCKTRVALLHDYDALILSRRPADRYREFVRSSAFMQGICWYSGNGVIPEDRLATTFEAFLDVEKVRRFHPIRLFNETRIVDGRSFDYDTLLDLQHNEIPTDRRTIAPVAEEDLVHPSQMICQYTMFRRRPGAPLPCFSIPMIPFFESLHAGPEPLERSLHQIRARQPGSKTFAFLRDDLRICFDHLKTDQVAWAAKQMIRASVARQMPPEPALYAYVEELYRLADTPPSGVWKGDFPPDLQSWIDRSRAASDHELALSHREAHPA